MGCWAGMHGLLGMDDSCTEGIGGFWVGREGGFVGRGESWSKGGGGVWGNGVGLCLGEKMVVGV